jgi:flavin-dependent dehydrogenase
MKSLMLTIALFVLSAVSMAQTPFSNNYFDATFAGGPVVATTSLNDARTSTNYIYTSDSANVEETVLVRLIDHDIEVSLASSNFYADLDNARGAVMARSTGTWQGCPFTYTFVKVIGADGVAYSVRHRYIIVGPREAYFITQASLMTFEDQAVWEAFEGSLNIKR